LSARRAANHETFVRQALGSAAGELTRNEARLLQEQDTWQIPLPLTEFAGLVADTAQKAALTA